MLELGVLLIGFLSAWAWNEIFLRFAKRLGALSQGLPHQRRWDSKRKPIIGGIAFFVIVLGLGAWQPNGVPLSRAFLAGGTIAFLTGLADDAFVSLPYMKLLGQVGAALATLILGGAKLEIGHPFLSLVLTLFWYVAVMNALNLMDNMDGVAGSLTLVLLTGSFLLLGKSDYSLLYAALIGAIAAFLLRNWYPSHLYMGDNGSHFLGYALAYLGIQLWHSPLLSPWVPWEKLLWLVGIFALLAADTFWVIISRLVEQRSPFSGGTDHLTHRLAQLGLSVPQIALSLAGCQGVIILFSFAGLRWGEWVWPALAIIGVCGISVGGVHIYLLRSLRAKPIERRAPSPP
ncbi:MAG: undecaprenyl/decaprenyl-phosphate alpha-N-acetylglucosaminyl 1-phosphate transferase [Bacteroidia bacterium]|nr:undecaprenyl/decaprenyl-phosphate alpha-N-acetylglucosaminyl 1-phosphate transferase [Bacteroidia bacterium]MDW8088673.1 MraY family glycosyltransferase [Bacteroidia bacterium]